MRTLKILLLFGCANVLTQATMNDYLDEKLKQTKIEIAKLYFREEPPVQRKIYNVQWDKLWQESRSEKQPFVVNAFDKLLLVEGNRVTAFAINAPPSNQSSQEVTLTRSNGPVKFIRSIIWKTVFYLLVCHGSGSCSLYTGADNLQLRHRQTIQHRGHPMDASFFVRANRLYLVVADNTGQFIVPSLIYHWRGTYMDVVAEAMTTAAVSVTTFKHKQSTIIVFAQNDERVPGIGSVVYEFKETLPDRIQFLSTFSPISVHHYDHAGFSFVFLINERGPSSLFWWDGQELLNWQQIAEIQESSLIHILNINDDTFFFVGRNDILRLYKLENASDCTLLSSMELPNGGALIDVQTRVDKSKVITVLVTMKEGNVYNMISWELRIEEIPSDDSKEESDLLSKHLAQLVETLQQRQPIVDKAESSWTSLLPADENLTISEPFVISDLILESGTVENINVFVLEDVVAPRELAENLTTLIKEVDDVLRASKDLLNSSSNANSLKKDIIVQGDAFIEKLQIDKMNVDFLNDVDIRSSDVNDSNITPRGKNIVVHNLEVDSLCGIPFQYWALKNDTLRMEINLEPNKIEFLNDTIRLHSNVSLTKLNAKALNDTNIDEFFSELFILGRNQRIKGNVTYIGPLQVQNLTLQTLNGKSWENCMTTNTDQSFDKFSARILQVDHLHAESINGVPISEAARVSQKNVIKGEVIVAKLQVTDKLTADLDVPKPKPLHIYYNVTVKGNLTVKVLDMDKLTKIFLDGREIHLNNISETFWTKSTDQVIKNDITFENTLIIDQLRAKYLNGFSEEEFLYTNSTIIPEKFKNLHFENVLINDRFLVDGGDDSFFDVAPESLTIRESLHLKSLRGSKLFTNTFNGLFVPDILNGKEPVSFPENMDFSRIRAKQVNVDELDFLFFNGEDSATFLENTRNVHQNRNSSFMQIPEFHTENLIVEKINDLDMEKLEFLKNINISDLKDLAIDGNLIVKGNFRIQRIGDQPPEIYLKNMANKDIVFDTEEKVDELIVQNASIRFLNDRNASNLFEDVLSKSREQIVPGQFSVYKIITDNVAAKFINNQDTSKFRWVDEPLFFAGNVTFHDLFVEDVITTTLNGQNINELYEKQLEVPITKINDLKVDGNVSWIVPSSNSSSLSFLFENAMIKSTDQIIRGNVTFENDVSVSTITVNWTEVEDIRNIINDAVIDDEEVIEVAGLKTFKEDLMVNILSVTDDMKVPLINDVNILEFNNSVVRKDQDETITGPISFLDEVTINQMLVNDSIHDVPLKELVLATDTLPPKVSFKHLEVLKDVYLKNLDGVDFDKFVKSRITTDGDHDITADVQFNGIVEVTGNVSVGQLNGIDPSDFVLDGTQEPQIISGSKIFEEDLVVNGNVYASLINGVDVSAEYSSGVQNDEDVKIIGDLIFESEVKVSENVSVSEMVNGVSLHTILDDLKKEKNQTLQMFIRNETKLEKSLVQSSLISQTLKNIFSYLETEEKLKIHTSNIKKLEVVYYEKVTKLNMFGEEPGPSCALPRNCSCPMEYVAELTKDNCRVWRTNGSTIVRNYHELHSTFGVNVITNAVSSSPDCTLDGSENEFTTISWMKSVVVKTGDVLADVKDTSAKIPGFVKDAGFCTTHDNAVFVILAIFYDPLHKTHLTNSMIYKIDFEKNLLSLHQKLLTDGAWDIEIFKTNYKDMYVLLGCFGNSKKSYLYKLDTNTSEFIIVRTFGGKTRNVKSLIQEEDRFILLDDFDTNAVNIFRYDPEFDNFYDFQSLIHNSRINGIDCFYADEFGQSDSFIIVTTENDQFYIYEYMFIQKFQLRVHHRMDGLQAMVPFYYSGNRYIFTGTSTNSTILRIVQQGPH